MLHKELQLTGVFILKYATYNRDNFFNLFSLRYLAKNALQWIASVHINLPIAFRRLSCWLFANHFFLLSPAKLILSLEFL